MASSSESVNDEQPKEFPIELLESVESVLEYQFKNRKLLEDALTHPSVADADSYLRLKFIGGAALRLAFSNHQYLKYTDLDPQQLSILRELNLGTEKLACLAVRYGLHRCVCHNSPRLCGTWVDNFVSEVHMHDQTVPYTGRLRAPQVLADIVESLAGAIYIDDELKLGTVWVVISGLLEPLITLDMINKLPQPATAYIEANIPEVCGEPEAHAKSVSTTLPEKRKASLPSGGLAALLSKKRKVSATAPMGPPAGPAQNSTKRGRRKGAKASELENMKARVAKLEAELHIAREASRRAEAAVKAREEELAREKGLHESEVENTRREAKEQALEAYGDEIVGVVNQNYFDSHIRALTLAGVAPRDPLWYNVEFPFEGTTPEMKFPWEGEGGTNGEPSSARVVEISE